MTARDHEALIALVRHRFLSYAQLERLIYRGRHLSIIGRRMKRIEAAGLVSIWEAPVRTGGRPRYVLPTAVAFRSVRARIESIIEGSAAEKVVRVMLPSSAWRPLQLDPKNAPAYLAHQREINHLLIAFARSDAIRVLWASSWDRPFPKEVSGLPMPQPDYVLVADVGEGPRLVLGEHDRAKESLDHFRRMKADKYAALAALPEFTEEIFGFRSFEVWVTVVDINGKPNHRMRQLEREAATAGAGDVMRFELAGKVAAAPEYLVRSGTGNARVETTEQQPDASDAILDEPCDDDSSVSIRNDG